MIDSLKNNLLQTWKNAQYNESTNPTGSKILDLIGAYGPEGWLNASDGFQPVTWDNAFGGVMEASGSDRLITVATAGTLYGFRLISSDAIVGEVPTDAGIDIKTDVKTVQVGDVIRLTDITLGIDD